jgi:hypothetical protein
MLVDVIAVTAGVAIILVTTDNGADDATGDCAYGSTSSGADTRKD